MKVFWQRTVLILGLVLMSVSAFAAQRGFRGCRIPEVERRAWR